MNVDEQRDQGERALELGEGARREARLPEAASAFARAAAHFRAAHDLPRLASTMTRQAQTARDLGRPAEARALQAEALNLTRGLDDPAQLLRVLRHLADILHEQGAMEAASAAYAEVAQLYDQTPDAPPLEVANAVRSLAVHAEALGDRAKAAARWQEARDRYAALSPLFLEKYGLTENPGVEEADQHLSELTGSTNRPRG
jgi:tetratricopeptide (TPR) repeat protein